MEWWIGLLGIRAEVDHRASRKRDSLKSWLCCVREGVLGGCGGI